MNSIPPKNVKALTKTDIVVLALLDAGGIDTKVHTEDVAVAAYKLAPESFSWKKYPEQISFDSVRVHLYDARKTSYGTRVGGSLGEGWYLTDNGRVWTREFGEGTRVRLGSEAPASRDSQRPESRQAEYDRRRMRTSSAFEVWTDGKTLTRRQAADVLRLGPHGTEAETQTKLGRFEMSASDDSGLLDFLGALKSVLESEPGSSSSSASAENQSPGGKS